MAGRIRSIKPEILEDEVAAALSDAAWRLWVSMWTLADDFGNLRVGERYLASTVWQDSTRDVATPLGELLSRGFISPYAVNAQRYGHINGWEKHQRVDNAGKARVPSHDDDDGTWNHSLSGRFAASLREPPQLSASLGESETPPEDSPLARRARAHSGGRTTTTTTTTTNDPRPAAAESSEDPQSEVRLLAVPPATPAAPKRRTPSTPEYHRIAIDWQPRPETIERFRREGWDAASHVEEFVNHWFNAKGDKGLKKDWDLTFVNRMKDLVDSGRAHRWTAPAKPPPPTRDMFAEAGLRPAKVDGPMSAEDISSLFDGVGKIA